MTHNTYPVRRRIIAATAAAVGLLSLEACDSGSSAPTQTKTITRTVEVTAPAPSPTESSASTEALTKAKQRFDTVAKATGIKILGDIANPKSNSDKYGGTYQGNKKYLVNNPGVKNVPEMFVSYLKQDRTIYINTINSPSHNTFNAVSMLFNVTGETAARLSSDVETHKALGVTDYIEALRSSDVSVGGVNVTDDADVTGEISLAYNKQGELAFAQDNGGGSSQILTEVNASPTVESFDTSLMTVEDTLHTQLNS